MGLLRIRQINLPYYTNINKSVTSSIVDTIIPLAGKLSLATQTYGGKRDLCARARKLARTRMPPSKF